MVSPHRNPPQPSRVTSRVIAGLAIVLMVAACTGDRPEATSTTGATSTTPAPAEAAYDIEEQLAWFVSVLGGEVAVAGGDMARLAPALRESFEQVVARHRSGGPYTIVGREGRDPPAVEAVAEGSDGSTVRILLRVDDDSRIADVRVVPESPPSLDDPPGDLDEAARRLSEIGTLRMVVAEVVDGLCVPVFEVGGDDPSPIGGVSRLYILGALADAISRGDTAWDQELVVGDDVKSIPPGELQERESGSTVDVLEAATRMVALSDNTAADLLLHHLGRDTVEEALITFGNDHAELNRPYLTTLEHAALKIGPASGLRTQYVAGDEARRRELLRQIGDIRPSDLPIVSFVEPVAPEEVGWFASPLDVCELHAMLEMKAAEPELGPLGDILTANPGGPESIPGQAFKGGAEPGLTAMSWRFPRPDGSTMVVAGSVVDSHDAFDQTKAALLFLQARDLAEG